MTLLPPNRPHASTIHDTSCWMINGTYYYIRLVRFELLVGLFEPIKRKKKCRKLERVGKSVLACVCVGLREKSENERGRWREHVI